MSHGSISFTSPYASLSPVLPCITHQSSHSVITNVNMSTTWQPPVLRWLVQTRRWWRADQWGMSVQATSVIPSTNGTAFRGFSVLINLDTRVARLCVTYVISCYTTTEYSLKKLVNMHGMWYTSHIRNQEDWNIQYPTRLRRLHFARCSAGVHSHHLYITGHGLRPIFLHDVTVRNRIKLTTEIRPNCCCCCCCET